MTKELKKEKGKMMMQRGRKSECLKKRRDINQKRKGRQAIKRI